MTSAHVVAGCRTAVTPRGGALSAVEVVDLASPVIRAVLEEACVSAEHVDEVILGKRAVRWWQSGSGCGACRRSANAVHRVDRRHAMLRPASTR